MGWSIPGAEGTTLFIDTDMDDREPWLGLKKADGARAMLVCSVIIYRGGKL